jgi:GNAT superfamily N-acetyltransferase
VAPRHGARRPQARPAGGRGGGGRIVGFSGFGPSFDEDRTNATGEVYAIYIEPELIGTGLGRDLFARTQEELRARGFDRATLWVLEANEPARRFYEKAGWRADGALKQERIDCDNRPVVRYAAELV